MDVYTYSGDGAVTADDFDAGTLFTSFTAVNEAPIDIDFIGDGTLYSVIRGYANIDITSLVLSALEAGDQYIGVRLSTETSDRYNLGEGSLLPVPFLTVIPEPATILFLTFGGLLLRTHKKQNKL
jgi:hypothetical protein